MSDNLEVASYITETSMEVLFMAQGLDSTKSAARPSHEAIEQDTVATEVGDSEQKRLDHIGMEAAKRGSNRIISNEEKIPSSTIFSK
jgi:hypothetical protein